MRCPSLTTAASYLRRLHHNESHYWNYGLHFGPDHFASLYQQRKRDIIGELLGDAFGVSCLHLISCYQLLYLVVLNNRSQVNRFEIDVGKCDISEKGFGGDGFGAKFRASFCNHAKLRYVHSTFLSGFHAVANGLTLLAGGLCGVSLSSICWQTTACTLVLAF